MDSFVQEAFGILEKRFLLFLEFERSRMALCKMSKSRGNVVLPEEVVNGIYSLAPGYEFRDLDGNIVDWKLQGVWLRKDTGYFTSTRHKRQPVFLHEIDNPIPCMLGNMLQHWMEFEFWLNLLEKYDAPTTP